MSYLLGNGLDPYSEDDLNTLQGLISTPDASSVPPAGYPTLTPPMLGAAPSAAPAPMPEPIAPVNPAPSAPAPVAPANLSTPATPPLAPLDLSAPPTPTAPKGLVRSEVGYSGVPDAEREKLMSLHQQLMDQQLGATDRAVQTEGDIYKRNAAETEQKIGAANVKKNTNEIALNGQMAAKEKLRAEGDEWSKMKDDPSKAFEGSEWAGVLAAIGIAAGMFAKNMGWQKDNPVQEAFDDHINRTIEAQRQQKTSRLNQIAARVGDMDDAIKITRAQMNDAIAERTLLEQQRARDKDTFDRLGSIAEDRKNLVRKDMVDAYQGLATREEQKFAPPKPAAGSDLIERLTKLAAADKALEGQGVGPDDPARQLLRREMGGVSQPTAAEQTNKEQVAKTAEEARKAQVAEINAQTARDKPAVQLKNLYEQVAGLPEKVYNRETESLPARGLRNAADFAFGKGAGEVTLNEQELSDSQKFKQAQGSYIAMLSVALGQGAMSGQEYENAKANAMAFDKPAQLKAAIANTLEMMGRRPAEPSREELGFKNRPQP